MTFSTLEYEIVKVIVISLVKVFCYGIKKLILKYKLGSRRGGK